jgi:hypothetical protein
MRTWCKGLAALSVLLFCVGVTLAADPPAQHKPSDILSNKKVQEELKLTPEQVDKGKEAIDKVIEKNKDLFDEKKAADLKPEERAEKMQAVHAELKKALEEVMKPEQVKRLYQIHLQMEGIVKSAAMDPDVQKALKLNDNQKKQLKSMAESLDKAMKQAGEGAGGAQAAERMIRTMRMQQQQMANTLLTAEQKDAWKELVGAPFDDGDSKTEKKDDKKDLEKKKPGTGTDTDKDKDKDKKDDKKEEKKDDKKEDKKDDKKDK